MFHLRLLSRVPIQLSHWKPPISRLLSASAIPLPEQEGSKKHYNEKIVKIVDDISGLTLIEVAGKYLKYDNHCIKEGNNFIAFTDLNELLKSRLNISDAPMMMAGNFGGAAAPVAEEAQEEEEVAPVAAQSAFAVKLVNANVWHILSANFTIILF